MLRIVLIVLLISSFTSEAAVRWTDSDWRGAGVKVNNVYLQWDTHWVQFYGGDGKSYVYYWGTDPMPNEKAKLFFSMLLTAFTADKKVSVAYDTEPNSGGHYEFSFLNIHN
ncbi:hypothetical protein Sps_03018 [Shewanella psychrophila]|uniref:Uncharacterized protein n=1 Tax=Shewanella psychrophila TaxID=225848 RepID=A0A1S6HRM0_9GAMM|nr:hypothetical protein [Shewanella psychrophila]AQS38165.1 hypothetical protein Sps_03018 [Shewanella psychrophila]